MQRTALLLVLAAVMLFLSCAPKYRPYTTNYSSANEVSPDYANHNYWAAHPYKYDPSDSIPSPLKSSYRYDSSVDVFFVHPTTFTEKNAQSWNADLADARLNTKTDYGTILYQASVFNEYRVFAPRYRQAHLRSYYSENKEAGTAFDTAYADIRSAFIYYFANYNNNRPLIIASHSQGTTHALRLLKEFKNDTFVFKKLIAAYLVGMYIPEEYSTILPVCRDSVALRCLCGWRSFQSNYLPSYVKNEEEPSLTINPLTWTVENKYAPKKMNKGSVLRNFNRIYYGVADAKIHEGVLWINKPQFPGSFFLRMKNYHIADINFFYLNIRENLKSRVNHYKVMTSKY